MPELQVKIVQISSGQAIQETIAALDKLTEAEKRQASSAKEAAGFFDQIRKTRNESQDTATYLGNLTKEAKGLSTVSAEAGKATLAKKALKESLHGLSTAVPEVSIALQALRSPFAAIAVGVALAGKALYDFKKSIDDAAEAAESINRLNIEFRGWNTLVAESKASSREFAQSLADIAEKASTIETKMKGAVDALHQMTQLRAQLRGQEKELALQKVSEDESAGRINSVEATKRRNQINQQFTDAERTDARNEAIREITIKEKAERDLLERAKLAEGNIPRAEQSERTAKARLSEERKLAKAAEVMSEPEYQKALAARKSAAEGLHYLETTNISGEEKANLQKMYQSQFDTAHQTMTTIEGQRDSQNSLVTSREDALKAASARVEKLKNTVSESGEGAQNLRAERQELARSTDRVSGMPPEGAQQNALAALPAARDKAANLLWRYQTAKWKRQPGGFDEEDISVLNWQAQYAQAQVKGLMRQATKPGGPPSFDQRFSKTETAIGESQVRQVINEEAKRVADDATKLMEQVRSAVQGSGAGIETLIAQQKDLIRRLAAVEAIVKQ